MEKNKKHKHYFGKKGPSSQGYGFSSSHIWMWEWDCKESWEPKNWCFWTVGELWCWTLVFWTVVLEKTLESPLDCKEIQPVHPKGNQSWIYIVKTDIEAETPILWPPDAKGWLIGKDPDAGKDWRLEEKRTSEDEMIGWHHWLNAYEFELALGVVDGQAGLVCCSPWVHKELDMIERLNLSDLCCGSAGKESACNVGDLGSVPGLGRSFGEGKGYPLQYSGPESSMDCIVHVVTKSWTWLSDFHFTSFQFLKISFDREVILDSWRSGSKFKLT